MEMTLDRAFALLDELWYKKDLGQLQSVAEEIDQQRPNTPLVLRYLGILDVLTGKDTSRLRIATAMGDLEAIYWQSVFEQFSFHPNGSVLSEDLYTQVSLEKLRRSHFMEFPNEVTIETQAICNAACTFCPYPTMTRQGDRMSDELINKVLEDLKQIPSHVQFTISPFKVSEPFLDKRIFAICKKINETLPNAMLRLFTNGSPLTPEILDRVVPLKNVVHLWVSLNEFEEVPYEKLMGLPFFKTIGKLDMLHARLEKGFPHPVTISRVADGTIRDDQFTSYIKQRFPLFSGFLIGRADWTGQVVTGMEKRTPPTACSRWYEISIMASGKVALCCMDGEGKHVIGDVNSQSVLEIYNSPKFRKMRQFTFSRLAAEGPCDTCVY